VSVCEREILVAKRCQQIPHFRKFRRIERLNAEIWEGIEKGEKLGGPMPVVPAKEPAVSFGDNQG
jgi:hypothetical protein